MDEPWRSQFVDLLQDGAASRDIHDAGTEAGYANEHGVADSAFIRRELERVALHTRSLVPLLAKVGHADSILDFGCGTGGTTLALATSLSLSPSRIVGVDLNARAIEAAKVRAASFKLVLPRIELRATEPGPLPFADASFDLAVTVSVLEFITDPANRRDVVQDLARVVRPGGFLFIATPRPWLREYHSGRWLGDMIRREGVPWSSPARQLRGWLAGWQALPLGDELAGIAGARIQPLARLGAARVLPYVTRWQKLLLRKPA